MCHHPQEAPANTDLNAGSGRVPKTAFGYALERSGLHTLRRASDIGRRQQATELSEPCHAILQHEVGRKRRLGQRTRYAGCAPQPNRCKHTCERNSWNGWHFEIQLRWMSRAHQRRPDSVWYPLVPSHDRQLAQTMADAAREDQHIAARLNRT